MEIQQIIGYLAAILIGLSLGMIGGGGSILTVPILVYLLHVEPVLATAYSLFVVGLTSLVGSAKYMKAQLISYKAALIFGLPSMVAVFVIRKFLIHALPDVIGTFWGYELSRDVFILLLFAILMMLAAISMIRNGEKSEPSDQNSSLNVKVIFLAGLLEGSITGIVGAGGGFLIIPALVLLAHLPMRTAVGTSLLIIGVKSLIGFTGDVMEQSIDWMFLVWFSALSVVGIFIGARFASRVDESSLKKGFGWFVLVMGIYIVIKELVL
ncbi:UPF0721 transmembrane protein [Echinicola pacifica]|uniref:Probable membrane transporter protein n=1 Tax=Echinicola pacifica TaxID=346377 RepID=A0A918UQI8_9BACT|nr:sulfite exporter TauE/SafE family protein [Echinicola pacifica]GGZ27289.1 UPF0721 transmembrane protein [Echinicola pacifica]